MSRAVVVSPAADRDVRDIREYYERQRAGLGAVFMSRATAAISQLGRFAELYGELRPGVRAAPIKKHPHFIIYRVQPDRVDVVAVVHGGRDLAVVLSSI